jgi:hypothetical protein
MEENFKMSNINNFKRNILMIKSITKKEMTTKWMTRKIIFGSSARIRFVRFKQCKNSFRKIMGSLCQKCESFCSKHVSGRVREFIHTMQWCHL